jgi:beta-lactamase superfamily II metal-dependent hydrolase
MLKEIVMSVVDGFQIDFIPVDSGEKSGDAITARIRKNGIDTIYVIDGGTKDSGTKIVEHIQKYYSTDKVDYLINTHPDSDHASGLSVVVENLDIGEIWLHQPWNITDEVIGFIKDGRVTENSLSERLEEGLKQASILKDLANDRGIPLFEPYQGESIGDFTVLSPSKSWYRELLKTFRPMPEMILKKSSKLKEFAQKRIESIYKVFEDWHIETLPNDASTSSENESSVVLYANLFSNPILLTGDAGVQALTRAYDYAIKSLRIDISNCVFYQVPHHGGRHNVTPKLLNKIISPILPKDTPVNKLAYVSVSKDSSDHPKRQVTNAFKRRGVDVKRTEGNTICRFHGFSQRDGWGSIPSIPFYEQVEE